MKKIGIIGTAALFLLLGTTVPVWAQHGKPGEEQAKSDKQAKGKGNAKAANQQSKGQEEKAAPQAKGEQQPQESQRGQQQQAQPEQRGRQQQDQQRAEQQNANQQRQANQQKQADQQGQAQQEQRGRQQQAQQQQRADQQRQVTDRQNADRQRQATDRQNAVRQQQAQQQPDNRPPGWDKGKKVGWDGGTVPPGHQARLPQARQQQLITEHQARRVEYSRSLDQQLARQREWAAQLQQQRRMTYYRYQQDYWARLRQQQLNLQRDYNYNNDPYFYTAANYRYGYGGNYYETNEYGANLLRQAINNGYAEGYRAGLADRRDRFGGGYQNSYAYQDANLGYNGMYVSQGDYNYYFREGFNRGYQDGYNGRYQYGRYYNGNRTILGAVLSTIFNLQAIR